MAKSISAAQVHIQHSNFNPMPQYHNNNELLLKQFLS